MNPTLTAKGDFSPGRLCSGSLPSKPCCGHKTLPGNSSQPGSAGISTLWALWNWFQLLLLPNSVVFPPGSTSVQDFASSLCHLTAWDRFVWRHCSVWEERGFVSFLFIIPLAFSKIQWNTKWADEILVFCPTVNPRIVLLPYSKVEEMGAVFS